MSRKITIGTEENLRFDNHFTIKTDMTDDEIERVLDRAEREDMITEDLLHTLSGGLGNIVDTQFMSYSSPSDHEIEITDFAEEEDDEH